MILTPKNNDTKHIEISNLIFIKLDNNILNKLFTTITGLEHSIIGFEIIECSKPNDTKFMFFNIFDGHKIADKNIKYLTGEYIFIPLINNIFISKEVNKKLLNLGKIDFKRSKISLFSLFKSISTSDIGKLFGINYIFVNIFKIYIRNINIYNSKISRISNNNIIEYIKYINNIQDLNLDIDNIHTKTLSSSKIEINNDIYKDYLRRYLYLLSKLFLEDIVFQDLLLSDYLLDKRNILDQIDDLNIFKDSVTNFFSKWGSRTKITDEDISFLKTIDIDDLHENIIVNTEKPRKETLNSIRNIYNEIYNLTRTISNSDVNNIPCLNLINIVDNINILSQEYLELPNISIDENMFSSGIVFSKSNITRNINYKNNIITTRNFDISLYNDTELLEILYQIDTVITSENQHIFNNLRTAINNKLSKVK